MYFQIPQVWSYAENNEIRFLLQEFFGLRKLRQMLKCTPFTQVLKICGCFQQEHLYEDFNLLNVRLDEMELLVSKLMQQTEPQEVLIRMPEIKKPATIVEIADDDEGSLHSVLSISSGSLAEEPTGLVKKTRKPSQAFLYSQSAGGPFRKDSKQDPVEIIRFWSVSCSTQTTIFDGCPLPTVFTLAFFGPSSSRTYLQRL